jgi:hypothetical protein
MFFDMSWEARVPKQERSDEALTYTRENPVNLTLYYDHR